MRVHLQSKIFIQFFFQNITTQNISSMLFINYNQMYKLEFIMAFLIFTQSQLKCIVFICPNDNFLVILIKTNPFKTESEGRNTCSMPAVQLNSQQTFTLSLSCLKFTVPASRPTKMSLLNKSLFHRRLALSLDLYTLLPTLNTITLLITPRLRVISSIASCYGNCGSTMMANR